MNWKKPLTRKKTSGRFSAKCIISAYNLNAKDELYFIFNKLILLRLFRSSDSGYFMDSG